MPLQPTVRVIQYVIFGSGLAFAAAVQPGPLQAFLLGRAVSQGWRRTLPAALSPLLSDIPVAFVALVIVGQLPVSAQRGLRLIGGVLLLVLAYLALRGLRRGAVQPASPASGPKTLLQAVAVNVVNPNPYLSWALVIGPTVAAAWRQAHINAIALVAAFYVTMVCTLVAFMVLAGTARLLRPSVTRGLVFLSALALTALGIYQLVQGFPGTGAV